MADPLFGVGMLILAATAFRDRRKCVTSGHDLRETMKGTVNGRPWKKTKNDPGTLMKCRRCRYQVYAIA